MRVEDFHKRAVDMVNLHTARDSAQYAYELLDSLSEGDEPVFPAIEDVKEHLEEALDMVRDIMSTG